MTTTREEMKNRTQAYGNRVVHVCEALPETWIARTLGEQLLRWGTSVGANHRAVCRAKSRPDSVNKLRIVEEECDESLFWMELLVDKEFVNSKWLESLMKDADELTAIFVASAKTARSGKKS